MFLLILKRQHCMLLADFWKFHCEIPYQHQVDFFSSHFGANKTHCISYNSFQPWYKTLELIQVIEYELNHDSMDAYEKYQEMLAEEKSKTWDRCLKLRENSTVVR